MATLPPDELLKLWKREQLPLEMSMGHVLQNLVNLRADFAAQHATLTTLRADVDRLIAHTRLPPNTKGKSKSSKPDETPDSEHQVESTPHTYAGLPTAQITLSYLNLPLYNRTIS